MSSSSKKHGANTSIVDGETKSKKRRRIEMASDRVVIDPSGDDEEFQQNVSSRHTQYSQVFASAPDPAGILGALRQAPSPLDLVHQLETVESFRQMRALSLANSLARSSFHNGPFPAVNPFPAISALADQHQHLPFLLSAAIRNISVENSVASSPSFLRFDHLMSLLDLQRLPLGNGPRSCHLVMPSAASAGLLVQPHIFQHSVPFNPSFEMCALKRADDANDAASKGGPMAEPSQDASPSVSRSRTKQTSRKKEREISTHKAGRGIAILFMDDDCGKLNEHQIFLRKQIELFRATQDDIFSYTRGKNKPIVLQQVGIRCRHCSHISVGRRQKGSTYFPSNLMGIYQAAQNLNVEHLMSGLCRETPPDTREHVATLASTKPTASGAGKKYWAEAASKLGLVDTEDGIRFASDLRQPATSLCGQI